MKITIAIIILVFLAIVGFFIGSNKADAPATDEGVPATTQELSTQQSEPASESNNSAAADALTFDIDSFSFGYSMEEIRVPLGATVTINLTNSAGFHDWVVDEFDAATEKIQAGGNTSVTFVADKQGAFEYYCSVGNHRAQGMVGTLIVE